MKPAHHVLDVKTVSPWLQIKTAPWFELKNCKRFHHRSQAQAVSNWTGSMHDISTYITSRDSTSTCTPTSTEHILVWRKHEKLENAALRKNYRHSGAFTELIELVRSTVSHLLETVGSAVASSSPPEAQKYLKVGRGRTLKASSEWTFRNIDACWRVRLKPSQALVPIGFIFVADFNTLMLLNVYITHECLPALMARIPLDVFLKSERNPDEILKMMSGIGVLRSGVTVSCTVCGGIPPLVETSLPGR